ncbi:MAG: hypothetical protein LBK06_01230 [Planctomycetaceae bacterium]|jgi:hypothetical protein|nr:hypothetical protein [Planctomycetaceae bacterium]
MSKVTENLSVTLEQLNELRAKFAPLSERVDKLNRKADSIAQSVTELVNEIIEVKNIVDGSANVFDSIIGTLGDVEKESEQINRNIDENNELRESMTSIFGEAFSVVSRFIDTAKHIGIIDDNRANQILAGKPIDDVADAPLPKIAVADSLDSTQQQDNIAPTSTDIATENTIEDPGIAFGGAVDAVDAEVISEDNILTTDNVLPEEIVDKTAQSETSASNNLSAIEMASQLDLQPLQFNASDENEPDSVVADNHKSETDDEEALEAILDDISKPLATV